MKLWQWLLVAACCAPALALLDRPAAIDAETTCSTLLRAACERQQSCPRCPSVALPCSAIVADQLADCVGRAAPGERFSSEAVGSCQRAMLGQSCAESCDEPRDPEACLPFAGLAGR